MAYKEQESFETERFLLFITINARSAAQNGRESLTGAHSAEGRVSQWSCHKWSSQGRFVPRRTEPKRVNGALA